MKSFLFLSLWVLTLFSGCQNSIFLTAGNTSKVTYLEGDVWDMQYREDNFIVTWKIRERPIKSKPAAGDSCTEIIDSMHRVYGHPKDYRLNEWFKLSGTSVPMFRLEKNSQVSWIVGYTASESVFVFIRIQSSAKMEGNARVKEVISRLVNNKILPNPNARNNETKN